MPVIKSRDIILEFGRVNLQLTTDQLGHTLLASVPSLPLETLVNKALTTIEEDLHALIELHHRGYTE